MESEEVEASSVTGAARKSSFASQPCVLGKFPTAGAPFSPVAASPHEIFQRAEQIFPSDLNLGQKFSSSANHHSACQQDFSPGRLFSSDPPTDRLSLENSIFPVARPIFTRKKRIPTARKSDPRTKKSTLQNRSRRRRTDCQSSFPTFSNFASTKFSSAPPAIFPASAADSLKVSEIPKENGDSRPTREIFQKVLPRRSLVQGPADLLPRVGKFCPKPPPGRTWSRTGDSRKLEIRLEKWIFPRHRAKSKVSTTLKISHHRDPTKQKPIPCEQPPPRRESRVCPVPPDPNRDEVGRFHS